MMKLVGGREEFLRSCESFVLYKHSLRNPQHLGKPRSPKVITASDLECGQERWGSVVTTRFSSTGEGKNNLKSCSNITKLKCFCYNII